MADWHGGFSGGNRGGRRVTMENEDFQEEEVWDIMGTSKDGSFTNNFSSGSSSSSARRFTNPRPIPRSNGDVGGDGGGHGQSSAPVEIPDWSKILKKKTKKGLWENDDHVDDDDDDGDVVPPHEYLAKRLQSTKIASFSMCEGVGRTLKGRDLSKLRNAILTKTGFLE